MRKSKKIFAIVLILLFVSVAAAGLLKYYAQMNIETNLQQAITVNGHKYNEPINFKIDMVAGDSVSKSIVVTNHANCSINVSTSNTAPKGLNISFFYAGQLVDFPVTIPHGSYKIDMVVSSDVRAKPYSGTIRVKVFPVD